jgi:hypothetical protein
MISLVLSKRMRAVVNTLSYFATKRQKNVTLIVSTTGDTGPAAVQAGECNNYEILDFCFNFL